MPQNEEELNWNDLQRPQEQMIDEPLENENQQQEEHQDPEPELQWGDLQNPSTYQGEEDPTADEGVFDYVARNGISNILRLGEQMVGKYGNNEQFVKNTLASFPQIGGPVTYALSELVGAEKWEESLKAIPNLLPTSEQFENATHRWTNGYTKPKTKNEAAFQDYTKDVGSILSPRRAPEFRTNFAIPAIANAAKFMTEYLGFGKDKADIVKGLVWTPLTLANSINAPQYASSLMNQGRNGIPNTLRANVFRMEQQLDALERSAMFSSADPRSAPARAAIAGLRRDLANGSNNPQSLFTQYDGLNAAKRGKDMFDLRREDRTFGRMLMDQVLDIVRDEIHDVGRNYPEAINAWDNGRRAWATIHTSNTVRNTIEDWMRGPESKLLYGPALALFGVGSAGAYKAPLVGGAAGIGVPAAYKTLQTIYRMWDNPQLAGYYFGALSEAMQRNAPAFIKDYLKLNKEVEKSAKLDDKVNSKKAKKSHT